MKNTPEPAAAAPAPTASSLARFWVCFAVTLGLLSVISGLMLFGLFLVMGYRIF